MTDSKISRTPLAKRLHHILQQAGRRRRWQEAVRFGLGSITAGLTITLLLIWLGRFYPLAYPLVLLINGVVLTFIAFCVAVGYALLRPHDLQTMAYQLDRGLSLDERLSTALELTKNQDRFPNPIRQAQLTDTLKHLQGFEPAKFYPLGLSWRRLTVLNLLAIAIVVGLLAPNPQLQILQQQAQTQAIIEEQAAQLEKIQAELLADEALLDLPEAPETLQTLDELIDTLQDGELSPQEAVAALSQAEQGLADLQDAAQNQTQTLNEVAQQLNQFASSAELAEAIESRDLAQAAEFLTSAANELDNSPPAAQTALADTLQQAAETAQATGNQALAEALSDAAEALAQNMAAQQANGQNGESQTEARQAAQQALQQAAEALANAEQQLANQEALEEALGNIQEAREQLAQGAEQGQPGQGQPLGQDTNPAQGQGNESNPLQGQLPGDGAGRGEPGDAPQDLFADRPDSIFERDNGPSEGRLGDFETEYPSIHWGGEAGPLVNPDPQGAVGGIPIGEAPVDPNQPANPALVPYDQVYGQYADAASEALADTYIPLGMKTYIRNYFGQLEPGGGQ